MPARPSMSKVQTKLCNKAHLNKFHDDLIVAELDLGDLVIWLEYVASAVSSFLIFTVLRKLQPV